MDVIDHEIVDFIDQVEIDFDTPISENKYDETKLFRKYI